MLFRPADQGTGGLGIVSDQRTGSRVRPIIR